MPEGLDSTDPAAPSRQNGPLDRPLPLVLSGCSLLHPFPGDRPVLASDPIPGWSLASWVSSLSTDRARRRSASVSCAATAPCHVPAASLMRSRVSTPRRFSWIRCGHDSASGQHWQALLRGLGSTAITPAPAQSSSGVVTANVPLAAASPSQGGCCPPRVSNLSNVPTPRRVR
jgi:hypothetical protein